MTTAEDYKLELVQVVSIIFNYNKQKYIRIFRFLRFQLFRHGARTCSESEAKIPMPAYIDQNLHESLGYGQLTNVI